MANYEDGSYSSTAGIALIAKVLAGQCTMNYTRAAVGSGNLGDDESPKTATEPAGYVMDATIAAISNPVDGECQVTVQINSSDVETGFYCTSVVLYAQDPGEGEVPYTYLYLENEPEWIRPASSVVGKLATFDLIAAVGDVDTVTATIDQSSLVSYSTMTSYVSEAVNDALEDAQSNITTQEITIPTDGWTYETSRTEESEDGEETETTYEDEGYHVDVAVEGCTEDMIPICAIAWSHLGTAKSCGLSTAVRTLEGYVRFYAESAPGSEIPVTLTLLAASGGTGSSSGIEAATDAETTEMLDEVYSE